MTTRTSIVLDTRREKKSGLYPLKLRVYFDGKTELYSTVYNLSTSDYEKLNAKRISDKLTTLKAKLNKLERAAEDIIEGLIPFDFCKFQEAFIKGNPSFQKRLKCYHDKESSFQSQAVVPDAWKKRFAIYKEEHPSPWHVSSLFYIMIDSLLFQQRIGTAGNYQTTYNSLKQFRGNIRFSDITPMYLREYESWIMNRGNSKTTAGIYTRVIRAVVNEAIERKLMSRDSYPFGRRRYAPPTSRNIKKALSREILLKIYNAKPDTENEEKAKDFWFFSFFGNGMNLKDIINLKWKNIRDEFLIFERAKTENAMRGSEPVTISCYINDDMRRIINRWANKNHQPDNYIFPVLEQGQSAIRQYELKENFIAFINNNMAKVCKTANLNKSVTIMEARHSASTIMKNAGVSPHFIKEMLGHRSLKTTENYLAGFEDPQKKEFAQHLTSFKGL